MKDLPNPCSAQRVLDISAVPGADTSSRLVRHRVSFPWSIGRGYRSESNPRVLTVIPQMAGAGLMAGDRFDHRIGVTSGALLELAPAGATLVHGSPGRGPAISNWCYNIQDHAALLIVPEPHVLMAGADLSLRQAIVTGPSGLFLGAEIIAVAPGVTDAGFTLETRIQRADGTPILEDVQSASPTLLERLGAKKDRYDCFATVLIVGESRVRANFRSAVDRTIEETAPDIFGQAASLRVDAGIGIRLIGTSAGIVRSAVRRLFDLIAREIVA